MVKRYLGIGNYNHKARKIVDRIMKAYKKFGLIGNVKKENLGYTFTSSQDRLDLLLEEIRVSFMEAGLI